MKPFKIFKNLLDKYVVDEKSIKLLQHKWNEPHRKYHNEKHLEYVLNNIRNDFAFSASSEMEKTAVVLAAFFHDAVYDPIKKDNEDESIKFFKRIYRGNTTLGKYVADMIECTKHRKVPLLRRNKILWNADNHGFKDSFLKFKHVEMLIREEFSMVPIEEYKEKRIEFLKLNIGLFGINGDSNIKKLIRWIEKTY